VRSGTMDRRAFLKLGVTAAAACVTTPAIAAAPVAPDARERHLTNLRQLTTGGQNAEAYFDWTGGRLVFQSTRPPFGCDQIFTMNVDGSDVRLVSSGKGRTTCAYFFPDGKRLIYATTQFGGEACPPPPDRSGGYVWPIYPSYEIVSADVDGGHVTRLTNHEGYDAEGAVSPDGRRIVFTSLREGDLDLHVMDADGGNVRRLTAEPGYDGGPFFSWDGRFIVFRASRPAAGRELDDYRALLQRGLVRPGTLEIFLMRADGTALSQVTKLGAASFAPFLHPNNQQIIFSSNVHDPTGRSFALHVVNVDGSGLERITWSDSFASFPMFSRDGKHLVFTANRGAAPREQNIFVADWES